MKCLAMPSPMLSRIQSLKERPAGLLFLLDHPVGPVPQVIRGAEPSQAGPDDQDHGALRTDSGAGGTTAPFAGLGISTRVSQTAATTARSTATPAMISAVAVATNIIARAAPPSATDEIGRASCRERV